jgi:GNAT superfamily N-acetyltransferase
MTDLVQLISHEIDDTDSDRVEITAMYEHTSIGSIVIETVYDAHSEFESAIFDNDITESRVNQLFPDDIVPSIKHLQVDSSYRKNGVGDLLMNLALDYFELQGVNTIYLNACPMGNGISLDNLISFYESYDFKPLIHGGPNVEMVRVLTQFNK